MKKSHKNTTKFGLFTYKTGNIGDDIQSLAAKRYLPQVDYFIDRDDINATSVKSGEEVKLIMNGWYTHKPENWPPTSSRLRPLIISMYIAEDLNGVADAFLSHESRKFLQQFGPVGARSISTNKFFTKNGIESYFSGCLTLTIQKSPKIKKQNFVLAISLPDDVIVKLKKESKYPVIVMDADITTSDMTPEQRFKLAEYFLYLYQSATCVITTRLHATLPCLALETPVLNIENDVFEPERFVGLRELANHMTVEEYLGNTKKYDVNNPPKNPTKYLQIREELEGKCMKYTGYINNDGFLTSSVDDLLNDAELLQIMSCALVNSCLYDDTKKIIDEVPKLTSEIAKLADEISIRDNEIQRLNTLGVKQSGRRFLSAIKRKVTKA
jgi:hypothetical protein